MKPEDSLIMRDEDLCTIPEKESDELINSSVEGLVPIPRESEDTSDIDKECDLPFCDNSVTFSNPLFDANDDFTSMFNGVLEDIESKDSYVSNLDEPALLVTPLSDANKDKCFDPRGDIDEIDAFLNIDVSTDIEDGYHDSERDIIYLKSLLMMPTFTRRETLFYSINFEDDYYDSERDIIYLESLLIKDTISNLPPEMFLDRDPISLEDERDKDDLKNIVKVFDPEIHEKIISPTNVRFTFEDRHYFSLTFVIRIFLPYLTYSMDSSFLLSSGSEDTILTPASPLLVSIL
ncbi:hypothetical protein Tco_1146248 [Tanacetum coccineum]